MDDNARTIVRASPTAPTAFCEENPELSPGLDPISPVYIAADRAIPVEFPIERLVAKNPDALLSESLGTNPMMALLLAGRKIDSPAPPMVMINMNNHMGASVPNQISPSKPPSNVT